jgi:prepilin-type N-terminal cleavage/methylation domain-containing protein
MAFTLMELLVTVLIISILLAVAIPSYMSSVQNARAKTAQTNLQALANAIQIDFNRNAYSDYSTYSGITALPANVLSDMGGNVPINPCTGGNTIGAGGDFSFVSSNGLGANTVLTISAKQGNCTAAQVAVLGG